ncbi:MAG: cell envelope integrity protein TolA [Gammaproteobacteria bacterium]|nr:cell envelope integrity protein TolA [Gammaproteobacteria bacterium]
MFKVIRDNPRAAVAALLMHLVIILFLIVGVDWLETPKPVKSGVNVVQARMVDQKLVTAELKKLKQVQANREAAATAVRQQEQKQLDDLKRRKQEEKKHLKKLEQQRKAEIDKKRQIERQRKAEERRLAETQAKQLAVQKKRESEKKALAVAEQKKKRAAEAQRKAQEKQKKAKLEQKRKADAIRKAEEAKKRKAEAARKAAEAKKRKAEAARKAAVAKKRKIETARKAREAELEAAMEAEHNARVKDRFMLQIQQKVVRNWVRLEGTGEGLKCKLRVRLAKGGNVLAVSVIESSGSGTFDRSAESAVYKADPLPVPEDRLFEQFRDIIFVFDPTR